MIDPTKSPRMAIESNNKIATNLTPAGRNIQLAYALCAKWEKAKLLNENNKTHVSAIPTT